MQIATATLDATRGRSLVSIIARTFRIAGDSADPLRKRQQELPYSVAASTASRHQGEIL
jgi:hypothetical protein